MTNSTKSGLYAFAVLCVFVLGAIGSIGYDFYCGAKLVGICAVLVAAMAAPYVVNVFKKAGIIGNGEESNGKV